MEGGCRFAGRARAAHSRCRGSARRGRRQRHQPEPGRRHRHRDAPYKGAAGARAADQCAERRARRNGAGGCSDGSHGSGSEPAGGSSYLRGRGGLRAGVHDAAQAALVEQHRHRRGRGGIPAAHRSGSGLRRVYSARSLHVRFHLLLDAAPLLDALHAVAGGLRRRERADAGRGGPAARHRPAGVAVRGVARRDGLAATRRRLRRADVRRW